MKRYRLPFRAMGSPCHLTLFAETEARAHLARDLVIAEVERIESRYSRYRTTSLLSRLNATAGSPMGFKADEEFLGLIDYARTCFTESEGRFDITSGILRRAWTFGPDGALPDATLIASLLPSIGFDNILIEGNVVRFSRPGMEIDLGGIAKEYAADCAASLLLGSGFNHGVVNFGGDIRIIGPQPDGAPWDIGIHHPRRPSTLIATLELSEGAVTTSGDYERALVIDGKYYSHLLDPSTGWPVEGLQSVSVVAPLALIAGSASTIAMLKGSGGKDWLEDMGLPCLWVDDAGIPGQFGINTDR